MAQIEEKARGGYVAAIAAFGIWGLFPLYLIGLLKVSAMQITAHRIVWSCVFVLGWLAVRHELGDLRSSVARQGVLARLMASAFFIAVNWVGFAWAVNQNHVLEVSLAYFMGPLLNILLGIFVLQSIQTGLNIVGVDSSVRYMVTGAVLLLAVSIDSVSRRARSSSGRG